MVDPAEHRIGIFFDGTQNNRNNSELREQCEEASLPACKSIEKLIGTESSYDGGPTNIARLHQAYTGPAIYIEGSALLPAMLTQSSTWLSVPV